MPCFSPLLGWRGELLPSGKRKIVFKRPVDTAGVINHVELPCGQCIGCRLERSRQWALRCVDEASLYSKNCFITLTYDEGHLPVGGGLVLRDFQLFMKKLRRRFSDEKIRFFHCGEYGDVNGRPHYHACLFGFDFPDKLFFKVSKTGSNLYSSRILNEIWGHGMTLIGDVTFESAAYVARYVLKKVTGKDSDLSYLDKATGEIKAKEYVTMSRRPGIGKGWFDKYKTDCFPSDFRVCRGVKMLPPKFYLEKLKVDNLEMYDKIKKGRLVKMVSREDVGLHRLSQMEDFKECQMKTLKREV